MKYLILAPLLLFIGCSSTSGWWDTGQEKERAYQDEKAQEQNEAIRNQLPTARPNF